MTNLIIPNHVAIILDGNRRWAKQNNLSSLEGHKAGFYNIKELAKYVFNKGVKYLSVFAFSTENFNRSKKEVKYLMDIFANKFKEDFKELNKENIKIVFSGRKANLRKDVLRTIEELTDLTKNNTKGTFNICLNYGGKSEITDAVKKLVKENLEITEKNISKCLYHNLPPVDLLIRTSGEMRISNFMLWECAYAEFYFPKVCFPDFKENEFDKAIIEYNNRERRFGGDTNENKNN